MFACESVNTVLILGLALNLSRVSLSFRLIVFAMRSCACFRTWRLEVINTNNKNSNNGSPRMIVIIHQPLVFLVSFFYPLSSSHFLVEQLICL